MPSDQTSNPVLSYSRRRRNPNLPAAVVMTIWGVLYSLISAWSLAAAPTQIIGWGIAAFTIGWWTAGYGLWRERRWGRILATALAALVAILMVVQLMASLLFAVRDGDVLVRSMIGLFLSGILFGIPSAVLLVLAAVFWFGRRGTSNALPDP